MRKPKSIEARSIVSGRDYQPYVHIFLMYDDGTEEQVTQWTPEDAYHHAMAVMAAVEAANVDAFLVSFLQERVHLSLEAAARVLPEFRKWRERKPITQ